MSISTIGFASSIVQGSELSPNDRHRLLLSERRRIVLGVLADSDNPTSLDVLSEEVARTEKEEGISDGSIERVETALHHIHLPLMADMDLLEYDSETGSVSVQKVPS